MRRFFCCPQDISSRQIEIRDKNELHHIKDVLRLRKGDSVVVLDGEGGEYVCQINQVDKNGIKLDIVEKKIYKREEAFPKITIACALPKKSKIDFIVEKLTELGVDKIILLKTERTEIDLKDPAKKIERLRKTAESALKQSGNIFMPEISYLSFKDLLKEKGERDYDLAVIADLGSDALSFKQVLAKRVCRNILMAIGPEGDFAPGEIELARKSGFISIGLGDSVLKVETAAIVAAGFIKLFFQKP